MPVSTPSASQPAQYSRRIGWRLACIRKLSSRESVHFTGRSSSHAASEAWAWVVMSSLPPKAPAVADQLDGDAVGADGEHAADVVAVVPHALAARVDVHRLVVAGA